MTEKSSGGILEYRNGLLVLSGFSGRVPQYFVRDERIQAYSSPAFRYSEAVSELEGVDDRVFPEREKIELSDVEGLRSYQKEAVRQWASNSSRGIVVLPTAAGKTHIGLAAISRLKCPTLVVAPTIELVRQWRERISRMFSVEVGMLGGGEKEIQPLTVSTYDSAYLMAEKLGNRFRFLLVDEVHHLASEQFMQIATMFASPYRLGLTATLERTDRLHESLQLPMGGKLFEMGYEELSDYLADYRIVRIPVDLSIEEQIEYDENRRKFLSYLRKHRFAMRGPWDFERFIMSSWTPEGREALVAWRRAREIAFSSRTKIENVRYVLSRHPGEKVLIFSEDTDTAYLLSREFLFPAITYLTPAKERKEYLDMFRSGEVRALSASRVLDEGIDVPDASVAIVISGSGSSRQFRQRLGRVLRPSQGKKSVLYEIVAKGTSEFRTSARRRKGVPDRTSVSTEG